MMRCAETHSRGMLFSVAEASPSQPPSWRWLHRTCLVLPICKPLAGWGWVGLHSAESRAEGWGGWLAGWLFKHTLQCTLTSRSELSCKARTGISSNSLGCADRGEGWKMLRLPLPFPCASPNVGENNECTECCERFIAEGERTGGNNAFLCNSSSLCNAWPFAKGTLDTKLGRPLYLSM